MMIITNLWIDWYIGVYCLSNSLLVVPDRLLLSTTDCACSGCDGGGVCVSGVGGGGKCVGAGEEERGPIHGRNTTLAALDYRDYHDYPFYCQHDRLRYSDGKFSEI